MADPEPATERTALLFEDSARRVGAYRWIEHRLFQVTGAWAVSGGDDAVAVHASEVSLQHAWHAELWEALLPRVAWADHDQLTAAPPPVTAAIDALAEQVDPAARLAGLYLEVLPRLVTTYEDHAVLTVPATDGPVIRALTLVCRDELDQLAAGRSLLASTAGSPEGRRQAEEDAARLDALLGGSAGLWDPATGPVSAP